MVILLYFWTFISKELNCKEFVITAFISSDTFYYHYYSFPTIICINLILTFQLITFVRIISKCHKVQIELYIYVLDGLTVNVFRHLQPRYLDQKLEGIQGKQILTNKVEY